MRPQAKDFTAQWITEFGDQVELVIANNDEMALGAIAAYEERPEYALPTVVGIDGTKAGLDAVNKGLMLGTVRNDAVIQAKAILNLAYASAKDLPLNLEVPELEGRYVWVSYQTVKKS
jgi:methyl-galactoside transport system substrate-binding protein